MPSLTLYTCTGVNSPVRFSLGVSNDGLNGVKEAVKGPKERKCSRDVGCCVGESQRLYNLYSKNISALFSCRMYRITYIQCIIYNIIAFIRFLLLPTYEKNNNAKLDYWLSCCSINGGTLDKGLPNKCC